VTQGWGKAGEEKKKEDTGTSGKRSERSDDDDEPLSSKKKKKEEGTLTKGTQDSNPSGEVTPPAPSKEVSTGEAKGGEAASKPGDCPGKGTTEGTGR
jgi:hypothetical protein